MGYKSQSQTLQEQSLSSLINKYYSLFYHSLGLLQDATAKLYVNTKAAPKFFRARPIPYRLKDKIEVELRRLQELGIITPVQHSEWASAYCSYYKAEQLNTSLR